MNHQKSFQLSFIISKSNGVKEMILYLIPVVILFLLMYFACKLAITDVISREKTESDKLETFMITLRNLDYIDNERMENMIASYRHKQINALSEELFEFEENDFEFEVDSYIRDISNYIKITDEEGIV